MMHNCRHLAVNRWNVKERGASQSRWAPGPHAVSKPFGRFDDIGLKNPAGFPSGYLGKAWRIPTPCDGGRGWR